MSENDNNGAEAEHSRQPEWDEAPVTFNLVQKLLEEHPEYRLTGHRSDFGNEHRLIEFPTSGEFESGSPEAFVSWVASLTDALEASERDEWPDFPCPDCGKSTWLGGFDDATTVDGEGEHREVKHCGVCEFVAIRRVSADD